MSNPELSSCLTRIYSLERAISSTEESNRQVDRVVANGNRFQAISKFQERQEQNNLGSSITAINELFNNTLEAMRQSQGEGVDLPRLTEFDKQIRHIENWGNKVIATYDQRWKFLHLIPFSKWRKAWLANQENIHQQHHLMTQNISELKLQSSLLKHRLAHSKFREFNSSLKASKDTFMTAITASSHRIQTLVQEKPARPTANELQELMHKISAELDNMFRIAGQLKQFATTARHNFEAVENECEKTVYLQVSFEEAKQAHEDIESIIQEVGKLTDSAIAFLESSLPDETTIFFTPMPDPEQSSSADEPTIADRVRHQLAEAEVLVRHCTDLLSKEQQSNKGAITLAYARTQEITHTCLTMLEDATKPLPNRSYSGKIEAEKAVHLKTKQDLNIQQKELTALQRKLKWSPFIGFLFKENSSQIQESIRQHETQIVTLKRTLQAKEGLIKKFEKESREYEVAIKRVKDFLGQLDSLSGILREQQVIDQNNCPAGEVELTLTNPIIPGKHIIPTLELSNLSNAYRRYIDRLGKLQSQSASASTAFSTLGTLIEQSVVKQKAKWVLGIN